MSKTIYLIFFQPFIIQSQIQNSDFSLRTVDVRSCLPLEPMIGEVKKLVSELLFRQHRSWHFFSVLRSNKSTIMCKKVLVKNTCVAKKSFYSLLLGHCEMDYTKVKEIIKTIARIVEYCWPFFVGNYFSNDSSTLNWWQENIFIDILQAFHKIVSWHLCIWSCSIP